MDRDATDSNGGKIQVPVADDGQGLYFWAGRVDLNRKAGESVFVNLSHDLKGADAEVSSTVRDWGALGMSESEGFGSEWRSDSTIVRISAERPSEEVAQTMGAAKVST